MNVREKALKDAIAFWEGKPDPKTAELGTYICDSCGDAIRDKSGTSLFGGWVKCAKCTNRAFPVQYSQDAHNTNKSDNTSTSKKVVETQSCKKCSYLFEKDILTCPNCGNTKWGQIILVLILSIGFLLLVIPIGFVGGKVFIAIIFGVLGLLLSLACIIMFGLAIKTRRKVKKEMTKKADEGEVVKNNKYNTDSSHAFTHDEKNTSKEQEIVYNSDPMYSTHIGNPELKSLYEHEPNGCLLCQNQNQLNLARFYFGSFKRDSIYIGLVRETKTNSKVFGHKSYHFCNNCIEKMANDRRKKMKKHGLNWIAGALLWFSLFIASAASQSQVLILGILIAGVVLAIRFAPQMLKNKREWVALSKKGSETKFEDFLDLEALKMFLQNKDQKVFSGVAFWTRNEYQNIFNKLD